MTTHRTREEDWVLKRARQYARMKLSGSYIDDGGMVKVSSAERDDYISHFAGALLREAETLLLVMAADEKDGRLEE